MFWIIYPSLEGEGALKKVRDRHTFQHKEESLQALTEKIKLQSLWWLQSFFTLFNNYYVIRLLISFLALDCNYTFLNLIRYTLC